MSGLAASPASMFLIIVTPCFSADDQLRRRKVKCSEEHPLCSRCIRGGFVCAGYAVPKPWIFHSTAEAQTTSRANPARLIYEGMSLRRSVGLEEWQGRCDVVCRNWLSERFCFTLKEVRDLMTKSSVCCVRVSEPASA